VHSALAFLKRLWDKCRLRTQCNREPLSVSNNNFSMYVSMTLCFLASILDNGPAYEVQVMRKYQQRKQIINYSYVIPVFTCDII
jgi:hypothetical protein